VAASLLVIFGKHYDLCVQSTGLVSFLVHLPKSVTFLFSDMLLTYHLFYEMFMLKC